MTTKRDLASYVKRCTVVDMGHDDARRIDSRESIVSNASDVTTYIYTHIHMNRHISTAATFYETEPNLESLVKQRILVDFRLKASMSKLVP